MSPPPLIFAFLLASLCGTAFHFVVGGNSQKLAGLLFSAWIGFALGHIFGGLLGVRILSIGQVNTGSAFVGAFIALMVTHLLGRARPVVEDGKG